MKARLFGLVVLATALVVLLENYSVSWSSSLKWTPSCAVPRRDSDYTMNMIRCSGANGAGLELLGMCLEQPG
jgi:hypothetical protein